MISDKMREQLNKQMNAELFSSYLYLAMAAYFEDKNLNGMANWMSAQSTEEYAHGMKFYGYLNSVGARVKLLEIKEPQMEWDSAQAVFEEALDHEKFITKSINDLADLSVEEKDHATNIFLHWFVNEQIEEVSSVEAIVDKFKMIGDNKNGLFMLDRDLARRQ